MDAVTESSTTATPARPTRTLDRTRRRARLAPPRAPLAQGEDDVDEHGEVGEEDGEQVALGLPRDLVLHGPLGPEGHREVGRAEALEEVQEDGLPGGGLGESGGVEGVVVDEGDDEGGGVGVVGPVEAAQGHVRRHRTPERPQTAEMGVAVVDLGRPSHAGLQVVQVDELVALVVLHVDVEALLRVLEPVEDGLDGAVVVVRAERLEAHVFQRHVLPVDMGDETGECGPGGGGPP